MPNGVVYLEKNGLPPFAIAVPQTIAAAQVVIIIFFIIIMILKTGDSGKTGKTVYTGLPGNPGNPGNPENSGDSGKTGNILLSPRKIFYSLVNRINIPSQDVSS